jgi:hypothetical protein
MSINAIGGAGSPGAAADSNWPSVLGASARVLGLSTASVGAQLRAGASLSQIAARQGVSQDALTQAIAGALSPSTQSATTQPEREAIASQIAQRPGGAATRHNAGDVAAELASLESDASLAPLLATYGAGGTVGAGAQRGATVDELA